MLSSYECNGFVASNIKLKYVGQKKTECVDFFVSVKRSDSSETYDMFKFSAYGYNAKYVCKYIKRGDCVGIRARPITREWKDKDTGKKMHMVVFIIDYINVVHRKAKMFINSFGGTELPDLPDLPNFLYSFAGSEDT